MCGAKVPVIAEILSSSVNISVGDSECAPSRSREINLPGISCVVIVDRTGRSHIRRVTRRRSRVTVYLFTFYGRVFLKSVKKID